MSRERNVKYIREEILKKNTSEPYYAGNTIYCVNTDFDTFPYPRWFQSEVKSDRARVAEREAGWAPRKSKPKMPKEEEKKPNTCWQTPCSTVFPCYNPEGNYISSNKLCASQDFHA